MPAKIYKVTITSEELTELASLAGWAKGNTRRLRRARILVLADERQPGRVWKDADIARALGTQILTVERSRANVGNSVLNHTRPTKQRSKLLVGAPEARLAQFACTEAPDGHERWSLQVLIRQTHRIGNRGNFFARDGAARLSRTAAEPANQTEEMIDQSPAHTIGITRINE